MSTFCWYAMGHFVSLAQGRSVRSPNVHRTFAPCGVRELTPYHIRDAWIMVSGLETGTSGYGITAKAQRHITFYILPFYILLLSTFYLLQKRGCILGNAVKVVVVPRALSNSSVRKVCWPWPFLPPTSRSIETGPGGLKPAWPTLEGRGRKCPG